MDTKTSKTPRVDEVTHEHTCEDGFHAVEPRPNGRWVSADFARTLERELVNMTTCQQFWNSTAIEFQKERDTLAEQVAGLRAALVKISAYTKPTGMQGGSIVNEIAEKALSAPRKSQFVKREVLEALYCAACHLDIQLKATLENFESSESDLDEGDQTMILQSRETMQDAFEELQRTAGGAA